MDLGIAGRAALVTASTKGLGRATAEALAAEGCRVAINGRDPDRVSAVARSLPGAIGLVGDVTDPSTPARLVAEATERLGTLDILVANAPGPPAAGALEMDDATLEIALEANLRTSIRLVRAATPAMRSAGWGRIVLLTSNALQQPIPDLAASTTARTGLWGWAKLAAGELAPDGVTLNLLCPGLHDTDRVRELGRTGGRLGDPTDFGRVAAFLCSEHAGFVSGTALRVDGAATLGLL